MTTQAEDTVPERLARIETKVDQLLERTKEDRTDFRGRIRALEYWRYGTGAAVIASVLNLIPGSTPKG
jgi:hypothetical protein